MSVVAHVACPHCGTGIEVASEESAKVFSNEIRTAYCARYPDHASRDQRIAAFRRPLERPKFVPNCSVNGHHEYWEGVFHGFFNGVNGPVALIETERGIISVEPASKIQFTIINTVPHEV